MLTRYSSVFCRTYLRRLIPLSTLTRDSLSVSVPDYLSLISLPHMSRRKQSTLGASCTSSTYASIPTLQSLSEFLGYTNPSSPPSHEHEEFVKLVLSSFPTAGSTCFAELSNLRYRLLSASTPAKRQQYEKYMKFQCNYIGVTSMPETKLIHQDWVKECIEDKQYTVQQIRDIAEKLYQSPFFEEKLAGTHLLEYLLLKVLKYYRGNTSLSLTESNGLNYSMWSSSTPRLLYTAWKKDQMSSTDVEENEKKEAPFQAAPGHLEFQQINEILDLVSLSFLRVNILEKGYLQEWASIDTLAGRVLKMMIIIHHALDYTPNNSNQTSSKTKKNAKTKTQHADHNVATTDNDYLKDKERSRQFFQDFERWKDSHNLWVQRAVCVSFVNLGRFENDEYTDFCFRVIQRTILNGERFAQLGTGWLLRELYLCRPKQVKDLITQHIQDMSSEGLRYACEKMPSKVENELKALWKEKHSALKASKGDSNPVKQASTDTSALQSSSSKKTRGRAQAKRQLDEEATESEEKTNAAPLRATRTTRRTSKQETDHSRKTEVDHEANAQENNEEEEKEDSSSQKRRRRSNRL